MSITEPTNIELKKIKLEELKKTSKTIKEEIQQLTSEIALDKEISKFTTGINETGHIVILIPDIFNDTWSNLLEEDEFFTEEETLVEKTEFIPRFMQYISKDTNGQLVLYSIDLVDSISLNLRRSKRLMKI